MKKLPQHISKLIKLERDRLGLTQLELATQVGMDHRRLSDLERKKRPATSEEAESLSQALGLKNFCLDLISRRRPITKPSGEVFFPAGERHFSSRLAAARRGYTTLVRTLEHTIASRSDAGVIVDFLDDLYLDSSLELIAVLNLISSDGQVAYESPGQHGYWGNDIVEPTYYRSIADRKRPVILRTGLAVFPQVSFAVGRILRVDFLVRYQLGDSVWGWSVVELDGPGHRADHSREALVHPVIRFHEQEVTDGNFLARLDGKIRRRLAA